MATLSRAKVEKVVNPPQNPMVRKARRLALNQPNRSNRPKRRPINKHPIRLTAKVPKGKEAVVPFCTQRVSK